MKYEKKRRRQRHRAEEQKTETAFLCPGGGARTTRETQGKAETEGQKTTHTIGRTEDHKAKQSRT